MINTTIRGAAVVIASLGTGLALVTGCSSPSSSDAAISATPTKGVPSRSLPPEATPTSSASVASGKCSGASILAALPAGSVMIKYDCAIVSPTMWAAARVNPGPTVYLLQTTSGAWKVSKADQACGTASNNLPKEIRVFCPKS